MTDIVQRLRQDFTTEPIPLHAAAADEIERLRAEVRSLHDTERWNIIAGDAPGELLICVGEHHKDEPCDFHSYISNRR